MKAVHGTISSRLNRIPLWREMVVVMMAGITLVVCLRGGTPKSASESGVKMLLPDKLRGMNGTPSAISEGERAILPKDTEIAKMVYQSPAGAPVSVQVVLSGGEKRSIHRPEICLPAQGWILESGGVVPVRLSNGRRLDVMRLTAKRTVTLNNGSRVKLENIFYYWFVGRGITTPYHLERILLTNLDMVFRNVNHRWAYVVVSAPVLMGLVPGGMDQGQTDGMLHDAVRELAPAIMKNP